MMPRSFVSRTLASVALAAVVGLAPNLAAPAIAADEVTTPALDPAIVAALARVRANELRDIDTKLVGFGTRNLFSEGSHDRNRGVYAARDWLAGQFGDIAKIAGDRMTVKFDTFVQEKTARTPRAVETSSVYATLRGDDPTRGTIVISARRISRRCSRSEARSSKPISTTISSARRPVTAANDRRTTCASLAKRFPSMQNRAA